jgi:hypothetical protein
MDEIDATGGERLTKSGGGTERGAVWGGVISVVGRLGGSCGVGSEGVDDGGGRICRLARGADTEDDLLPFNGPVLSTLTQSCSSLGTKGFASRFGLGTKPFPGGRTVVCAGRPRVY